MMRCSTVRRLLAVYDELNMAQQAEVRRHMAECRECTAAWEAYRHQDAVLTGLPDLAPARDGWARIRSRIETDGPAVGVRRRSPALVAAIWALVLLLSLGGTARVSAGALPGEGLYPVKRAAEQVRLALTLSETARARYQDVLAAERRREVAQVVAEKRTAQLRWEAVFDGAEGGVWTVEGVQMAVGAQEWAGNPPAPGTLLSIEAHAQSGELVAQSVQVVGTPGNGAHGAGPDNEQGAGHQDRDRDRDGQPTATPVATATPSASDTPAPTATPTAGVTATPTAGATSHGQGSNNGNEDAGKGNDNSNGNGQGSSQDDEGQHGAASTPGAHAATVAPGAATAATAVAQTTAAAEHAHEAQDDGGDSSSSSSSDSGHSSSSSHSGAGNSGDD